jgi:glycosylphosphatidylinositol transamidase (GPIT) subunit GPI8
MYRSVKSMGIPDSQITLMLADDMICHAILSPWTAHTAIHPGNRGVDSESQKPRE